MASSKPITVKVEFDIDWKSLTPEMQDALAEKIRIKLTTEEVSYINVK